MPPKNKFSKQDIVDTAFEIARAEGIDKITIRKIAEKLGSSIAPIYVNFQDVEELKQAIVKKTFAVGQQLLMEQNSGNPFQDIGLASLRFAKEYSMLFRDLMLNDTAYMQDYDQEMGIIVEHMKKDPDLAGFTDEELMEILLKMRIFQLGLSVMVANKLLPEEFNENRLAEILDSTATDVVIAARMRKEETHL